MATIDSVKFYMSRAADRTGWNLLCSVRAVSANYTLNPGGSTLLGSSDAVAIDDVPIHGSQDWVTFTFSTPVTIGDVGFYSIQVWSSQSDYQHSGVYVYDSTVWLDASGGVPYFGKERGWRYNPTTHVWDSGGIPAYQIICTDNVGNSALTPTTTYETLGGYNATDLGCIGVRSYISELPGKPTGPTPANGASDITLHSTTGTWVSGGNTDSYRVLYGTLSGFLELVEEGVTDLSLALVPGNFSVYGRISYWRVDAVNEVGTTQGVEWVFTTMLFDSVLPTGITLDHSGGEGGVPTGTATGENNMMTVRRLVAVARNKIFYEA